jgi:mannosyltransferase OCH1-like enzyme
VIPRTLHYVWVGPKPVPKKVRTLVEGWQRLNPDYDVVLWNEENIDFSFEFVQSAYSTKAWNRISDFVRMWALLHHGGIYLDTDVELRKPLDALLENTCFAGFQMRESHPDWVNGAVLGAERGHWFIARLHRYFVDNMRGWENVGSFSGPGLITRLLTEQGLSAYSEVPQKIRDITLYPTRWFYPYHWSEPFVEQCVTPDTYAIHHWDKTWTKSDSAAARLSRFMLRATARINPRWASLGMRAYVRHRRQAATFQ